MQLLGKGLEGKSPLSVVVSFAHGQHGFVITNGLMLGALWAAGIAEAYLLIWCLPWLTGYSVVLRLRSIAERAAEVGFKQAAQERDALFL